MTGTQKKLILFWFRRDLRLEDNAGLYHALKAAKELNFKVQPLFIFDTQILSRLKNSNDRRVPFIYNCLQNLDHELDQLSGGVWLFHDEPSKVYRDIIKKNAVHSVYCNHDYEPYARSRDEDIKKLCESSGVQFHSYKDQVIFEKSEIVTAQLKPYTVYTPYKNKWLDSLDDFYLKKYPTQRYAEFFQPRSRNRPWIEFSELDFQNQPPEIYPKPKLEKAILKNYAKERDYPALNATSHLGLHLRFGTLSVRELVRKAKDQSDVWVSELIWREFFMQILFHFPLVEKRSFREAYEKVEWRENEDEFERWCQGETGYPIVDAGMRELNATGYMHNRVRMVVASFLTKHLLIHWYRGERYFARQLLDYDLAANNGNWQWAAGTGCDAAPYFRIFNPESQTERFDPKHEYIKKWVPEYQSAKYPKPMVDHKFARERALKKFKAALKK